MDPSTGHDSAGRDGEPPGIRFTARKPKYPFHHPAAEGDRPSVLAFSYNKAGSTLLNDVVRLLCPHAGLTYVSIPETLFHAGVPPRSVTVEADMRATGCCYGGYRFFPDNPIPLLDHARTVLLVRDPRDVIVSLYHSIQKSHAPPGAGKAREDFDARRDDAISTDIDAWAIQNHGLVVQTIEGYVAQGFLNRPNVAVYRYEDIIFRKREWLADMMAWYEWVIPEAVVAAVLARVDVIPTDEDPSRHIRQVKPGNYRTALQPSTQKVLAASFGDILRLFNYET